MRLALKNNFEDGLWRLSFSGIIIVGFTVASIPPYRSIIGIEQLGLPKADLRAARSIGQ